MKLIIYTGNCKSLTFSGQKFTSDKKTAIVSDEVGKNFEGREDFQVKLIQEEVIVPPSGEDEKRKKLMKLTAEQLKEMCENSGVASDGKKEDMVERLMAPKE